MSATSNIFETALSAPDLVLDLLVAHEHPLSARALCRSGRSDGYRRTAHQGPAATIRDHAAASASCTCPVRAPIPGWGEATMARFSYGSK